MFQENPLHQDMTTISQYSPIADAPAFSTASSSASNDFAKLPAYYYSGRYIVAFNRKPVMMLK
jgi:hypothetical protein